MDIPIIHLLMNINMEALVQFPPEDQFMHHDMRQVLDTGY